MSGHRHERAHWFVVTRLDWLVDRRPADRLGRTLERSGLVPATQSPVNRNLQGACPADREHRAQTEVAPEPVPDGC